jgi:Ca2+-binding RTX toxin-like protein
MQRFHLLDELSQSALDLKTVSMFPTTYAHDLDHENSGGYVLQDLTLVGSNSLALTEPVYGSLLADLALSDTMPDRLVEVLEPNLAASAGVHTAGDVSDVVAPLEKWSKGSDFQSVFNQSSTIEVFAEPHFDGPVVACTCCACAPGGDLVSSIDLDGPQIAASVIVSTYEALLYQGGGWNGSTVGKGSFLTFSFDEVPAGYLLDTYSQSGLSTFAAFNAAWKDMTRAALNDWASISGITFFEVGAGQGEVSFGGYDLASLGRPTAGGFAYVPFGTNSGAISGDVFIRREYINIDPTSSTFYKYLMLHEIGHAIGLKHPFDDSPNLPTELDNVTNTVMSYTFGGAPGNVLGNLDVSAIQYLYGTNANDGTQVSAWNWNALQSILSQTGFATADNLMGTPSKDVIDGGDGNDTISGRGGNDSLDGGLGNDSIVIRAEATTLSGSYSGGVGQDVLQVNVDCRVNGIGTLDLSGGGTYSIADFETIFLVGINSRTNNIKGGASLELLYGGNLSDTLDGGVGNDTLFGLGGNDLLLSSAGADSLSGGSGNDTIQYDTNTVAISIDMQAQTASGGNAAGDRFNGIEVVIGSIYDDTILGTSTGEAFFGGNGNDTLEGRGGNDTLQGGAGFDRMVGGANDDTYYVDSAFDTLVELAAEGNDTVFTGVNYTLAAGVIIETLAAANAASTTAISLTGNEANTQFLGTAGDDTLNGGTGSDTLYGFAGNDYYYVEGGNDVVVEGIGAGIDVVFTQGSVNLAFSSEIETLAAFNAASTIAIVLGGNEFNNQILASAGNDELRGDAGNDTLYGYGGTDTLIGGVGIDVMLGGSGNDIYYVDNIGDIVTETTGSGTDTVFTTVSFTITLGTEIEVIAAGNAASTTGLSLTGNELANQLLGTAGGDTLVGGSGADTLYGFSGNDFYYVDSASDVIIEAVGGGTDVIYTTAFLTLVAGAQIEVLTIQDASTLVSLYLAGNEFGNQILAGAGGDGLYGFGGNDTIYAYGGNDFLSGGSGADYLFGGDGADTLFGADGADYLIGGNGADVFRFTAATDSPLGGQDIITDFVSGTDKLQFTGFTIGTLQNGSGPRVQIGTNASDGYYHLLGDFNGDGVADFDLLVQAVNAASAPVVGDFLL